MPKVAIVTDSCASIPENFLESLNIYWVPYYIHRGKEVLRDLVTIQRDAFYSWLPTAQELPTTASPGPGDYLTIYSQVVEETGAKQIVSIHMTSKGSGAYQAAKVAQSMISETLPDIQVEVIDTLNVSMCHGWMVIEAARAALAGRSLADIVEIVRRMIPVTRMIQTADTLKYLYMGGRIGRAKHLVGTLLKYQASDQHGRWCHRPIRSGAAAANAPTSSWSKKSRKLLAIWEISRLRMFMLPRLRKSISSEHSWKTGWIVLRRS